MHRLSQLIISNFRSFRCFRRNRDNPILLNDLTAIVGYNNTGKSTLLSAIEWLIANNLKPKKEDFNDITKEAWVFGVISDIDEALLDSMASRLRDALQPYIAVDQTLRLRRTIKLDKDIQSVLTVRDPSVEDEHASSAWVKPSRETETAIKMLLPEPIRVTAVDNLDVDVAKSVKNNTISRLIKEISQSFCDTNQNQMGLTLQQMGEQLSTGGKQRPPELVLFDDKASKLLGNLFPGMAISLNIPMPTLPELLHASSIKILEGKKASPRAFNSIGQGAQCCIHMALIRYLAEQARPLANRRTLLLVDKPELYLHPQGIEHVRLALQHLSNNGYQVVFTTHSPLMLHRDYAAHTVMMYKPKACTIVYKPLTLMLAKFVQENPKKSQLSYELSDASTLFFSEQVLIVSGKTEAQLLPVLYEKMRGCRLIADRIGLVVINDEAHLGWAWTLLKTMGIRARIIAGLGFAFKYPKIADKSYVSQKQLEQIQQLFAELAREKDIKLGKDGFPRADQSSSNTAKDGWAQFVKHGSSKLMIQALCERFKADDMWLWPEGSIEHALKLPNKGQTTLFALEQSIVNNTTAELLRQYPGVNALFDWLNT